MKTQGRSSEQKSWSSLGIAGRPSGAQHHRASVQHGTFTSRCAMLIECRYWMASPMLFIISEASEARK